ncbi:MAG: hypothetical protein V4699_02540 [Patescibacteria group bacterium]
MKFIKKNWCKLVSLSYIFTANISVVYADVSDSCPVGTICNPIKAASIQGFIKTLLEGVLKIGIPVVALAIIYCGFLFVAARGNTEKLTKAKDALLYTLIGAGILLGSWAIATMISATVTAL